MTLRIRGRLPQGGIAIVGSRWPPAEAAAFAFSLARRMRVPVVAGLAPGIDAAAHHGALTAGIPTVAFLGYGFGRTDSPELGDLEDAIVAAGGAVATLLPPGTRATEETRIARDRLQAEQAQAVLLVCSEIGGGAMHTMEFAREAGRPRLAVSAPPGASTSAAWAGNQMAIKDGATPVPLEIEAACREIFRLDFDAWSAGPE